MHRNLKNLKEFTLLHPFIILSYDHDAESDSIQISQDSHGNTKAETAFRPTAHSTKQEVKERMSKDGRASRLVLDDMGFNSNILGRETQSDFPRNTKQIKNYRFNYREKVDDGDDYISSLIMDIVQQNEETAFLPLDPNQPFLRQIIFRDQKKANIVLYTNQTLKDMERFCTKSSNPKFFSTYPVDTTYNIANHYLTHGAYQNLSLLERNELKHPWFPGIQMFHRSQEKEDVRYMWQAAKRGNRNLKEMRSIGTDECDALSDGILEECTGLTLHLLGL